jgi:hypothetical protein
MFHDNGIHKSVLILSLPLLTILACEMYCITCNTISKNDLDHTEHFLLYGRSLELRSSKLLIYQRYRSTFISITGRLKRGHGYLSLANLPINYMGI